MPFQSDKQRKYLWANEPEIAREWTDRYGANQGGIARLNYIHGGIIHPNGRRGFPGGAGTPGGYDGGSGSGSGSNNQGGGGGGHHQGSGVDRRAEAAAARAAAQAEADRLNRQSAIRDDIARREEEKDYVDKQRIMHDFGQRQLIGQQRKQEYKPSFFNRLGGGIGNLLRGAGNLIGRLPINPMTLASGGLNFMGQDKLAQLLASINLGKGGNFFNKQNNTIDNNQSGLFTDRMNDDYVDEGRIGEGSGFYGMDSQYDENRLPFNLSADTGAQGIGTLEDQMREIFTTS